MKILIVVDDPSLREFLLESIRMQGHKVVSACDGCEGLKIFQEEAPDLVFTDIRMPKMDGFKFLTEIRNLTKETIVIIVTGLGSDECVLEAMRRSANDFLRKPIHHNVLFPLLAKYSGIVETHSRFLETINLFTTRSAVVSFDNRLEMIPHVVQRLLMETGESIPRDLRLGIRIGLVELMTNAIEHGNLQITCEEKLEAMRTDFDGIQKLHSLRLKDPNLAARRVQVEFTMDKDSCTWTISDEGNGFDWKNLPNPLSPENLDNPNGRGIFLARLHIDEVEFQGKGNKVRVMKKLPKPQAK